MADVTINSILAKIPRWPNRTPVGDAFREIERKLAYYGEGYSQHDLKILDAEVDNELRLRAEKRARAAAARARLKKEAADNGRIVR